MITENIVQVKSGIECIKEDREQLEIIQKSLDMIIGHTREGCEVTELICYYRGHKFGIRMINE